MSAYARTVASKKDKVWSTVQADTLPAEPHGLEDQIAAGTLYRVDPRHMRAPKAVYSPDPQYSEEARGAKHQGDIVLGRIVGADGKPDVWAVEKLGLGCGPESHLTRLVNGNSSLQSKMAGPSPFGSPWQ